MFVRWLTPPERASPVGMSFIWKTALACCLSLASPSTWSDVAKISELVDSGAIQAGDALPIVRGTDNLKYTGLKGALDAKEDAGTAASAVSTHEAALDPHTAYLTVAEGDAAYEALGAVATHEAALDPHPGYLTSAEGNAAYAAVGHNHDAAYSAVGHSHSGLAPAGGTTGQVLKKSTNADYDYAWAADSTGAGGSAMLCVVFVADGANLALTNMATALGFLAASHRFATKVDLTGFTQVRLIVNKQATAGAAASKIILRYRTAFDVTPANWLDIGASEVSVAINVQNTVLASSWINLAAGAIADVFVCPLMSGGDGALDPAIGHVAAQFK